MSDLLAAATKVDITPFFVQRTYLAGFAPDRVATGVADPLSARVLYLEHDGEPLVIITADLIGLFLPDVDRLKSHLEGIAPEHIVISCSHTHSGPDTMGIWGPAVGGTPYKTGRDPEYFAWLVDQIASGVTRARLRKRPAVIAFAEDTQDKSEWVVNLREAGYYDQVMSVMRVDGTDGRPIACFTNFACHPETLWDQNTLISPDYVHYLHRTVEEKTGAVSVFANGALGGMVTMSLPEDTPLVERRAFVKKLGKALGQMAADAWAKAEPADVDGFHHRYERIWVPFDNKEMFFASHLGLFEREIVRDKVETVLHTWRIGPAQFVTLPGEALPAVGERAKKMLSGKPKFLLGLGDDELGYLLLSQHENDPAYKYERTVSIGPAGVNALLDRLAQLVK